MVKPNNTLCNDALFNLGGLSMEPVDPSVTNGICPDTIFVPISAGIIMFVHLSLMIISGLLLFYKRKHGHIVGRNIWYMVLTMITSFFYVESTQIRFAVSRKIYPCALNSFNIFMLAFTALLPTIFKCVRIFFLYRLNLETKQVLELEKLEKDKTQNTTHNKTDNSFIELNSMSSPSMTNQAVNFSTILEDQHVAILTNKTVDVNEEQLPATQLMEQPIHVEPVPQESLLFFGDILLDYQDVFDDSSSSRHTTADTESTYAPSVLTSDNEYTEISNAPRRKIQIYKFIVSYKFIIATYVSLFFIHLGLWLILAGADQTIKDGTNEDSKRLLVLNVGPFDFTRGCIISNNLVFIIAAQAIFYMVIELCVLIMCFFADRDTWFMKGETIIIFCFQIVLGIIYLIVSNLNIVKYLTDYFFSYANVTVIYSIIELFICVTLPCIYAIVEDFKKQKTENTKQEQSIVEVFLRNKRTYELLLDYARRSYCQESVQCWKDIQKFKTSSKKNRAKVGKYILKTYLVHNAPVELNLSAELSQGVIPNIEAILSSKVEKGVKTKKISKRLFEEIELHCVTDITDVFERLKASNKKVRETVGKWKIISEKINKK